MALTKNDLSAIEKIVKKSEGRIIKRMDYVDKFLDREHMSLVKRVDRIENHLQLTTPTNL